MCFGGPLQDKHSSDGLSTFGLVSNGGLFGKKNKLVLKMEQQCYLVATSSISGSQEMLSFSNSTTFLDFAREMEGGRAISYLYTVHA